MTITSKFASQCRACGQRIQVGEKIEWTRGQGATHVAGACGDKTTPRAWLARQPKNVRDAYRLSADERAQLKAEQDAQEAEADREFEAEWTREVTIERRAFAKAAHVQRWEVELDGWCERIGMHVPTLNRAIRFHGLA